MADRPIPFSAPMVRALLDGQKARDAAREEVAFLESLLPASDALTETKKIGGE